MSLCGKINATLIEGAANIFDYIWYCLESVSLHEHNEWPLDDEFTGMTVDWAVRQD